MELNSPGSDGAHILSAIRKARLKWERRRRFILFTGLAVCWCAATAVSGGAMYAAYTYRQISGAMYVLYLLLQILAMVMNDRWAKRQYDAADEELRATIIEITEELKEA